MATNKHIIDIQTKGAAKSKREIQGITSSIGKMAVRAGAAAAAFYAAKGLIQGMTDLAKQASAVQQLERGFNNLGNQIGFSEQSFAKLDRAVNGTMKQVDLMTKANNAMFLGIVKSDDEMAQLFDTAQRLGQALGLDTAQAIDSIVTGMGRQSKLMLDNLGIIIDTNKAYEDYALTLNTTASALTETQKKQAFNNAVLAESKRLVEGLGAEQEDAAIKFAQFDKIIDDVTISLGELLTPVALEITEIIGNLAKAFDNIIKVNPSEEAEKERVEFNLLLEVLKDVNVSTNSRKMAIEALQSQFPTYLGGLDIEKATIEDINKLQEDQVGLMEKRIKNMIFSEQLEGVTKKLTEEKIALFQLEKESQDEVIDLGIFGTIEQNKTTETLIKLSKDKIAELEKERQSIIDLQNEYDIYNQKTTETNTISDNELSAKDLFIQKLGAELSLKQQQIEWTDEFIEKNKELARSMNLLTETQKRNQKGMRGMVSDLQVIGSEFKEFEGIAKTAAIAQTIFDTYSSAQKAFYNFQQAPAAKLNPPLYFGLGVAAAATATVAGLARVSAIRKAQYGADFVTDGPQMMMVGEGSGPERVQVTPLQDPNIDGPQAQGMTINIQGSVIGTEEFTENTLLPQIREGIRLGEQI